MMRPGKVLRGGLKFLSFLVCAYFVATASLLRAEMPRVPGVRKAAPQPPMPQPEKASLLYVKYRVRRGDNPSAIARKCNTPLWLLMRENGISHSSAIYPGNTLEVPKRRTFTAVASWYGPGFHGRRMANGEVFDQTDPTNVANKCLPLGTKVSFRRGKKIILAVVKDRGPYIEGRHFDLSKAAAQELGMESDGVAEVHTTIIELGRR